MSSIRYCSQWPLGHIGVLQLPVTPLSFLARRVLRRNIACHLLDITLSVLFSQLEKLSFLSFLHLLPQVCTLPGELLEVNTFPLVPVVQPPVLHEESVSTDPALRLVRVLLRRHDKPCK